MADTDTDHGDGGGAGAPLPCRLSTPQGRAVLLRRIKKGRWRLAVDCLR